MPPPRLPPFPEPGSSVSFSAEDRREREWVVVTDRGERAAWKGSKKLTAATPAKPPLPPALKGGGRWRGKNKAKAKKKVFPDAPRPPPKSAGAGEKKRKKIRIGPVPRSAAVSLTIGAGSGLIYADVMGGGIRRSVDFRALEITNTRLRRAANGGILLEIPGPESETRADRLAEAMRRAFAAQEGVRIDRPVKTADMRFHGLDDSLTEDEVVAAIAAVAGCPAGSIRFGSLRGAPNGLLSVWMRGPVLRRRRHHKPAGFASAGRRR